MNRLLITGHELPRGKIFASFPRTQYTAYGIKDDQSLSMNPRIFHIVQAWISLRSLLSGLASAPGRYFEYYSVVGLPRSTVLHIVVSQDPITL